MTRSELFQVLRPIVLQVTGVPACMLADPTDSSAQPPSGEYCVIEPFDSLGKRGQAAQSWSEVDAVDGNADFMDLEHSIVTHQEVRASINFYRGGARDYANLLQEADKFDSVQESLYSAGVGWLSVGSVNNLTTLVSGLQEPRHQIYVNLLVNRGQTETIQQIYVVSGEAQNENGDTLSTF